MPIKKALDLVASAKSEIENLSVDQVKREMERGDAVIVDIRDSEERAESGAIPSSEHVTRGMLEFNADPACRITRTSSSRTSESSCTAPPAAAPRSRPRP
jgi:hypothetical protein